MTNVGYDREIETESDLSIRGKLRPADTNNIFRSFGGTEREDIRVSFSPDSQDNDDTVYSGGPAVHKFDDSQEAQEYVDDVLGGTSAQPLDEMDSPAYHTELGEEARADTIGTSIPNPSKLNIDGEIEGGVRAIPLEGDTNGFYQLELEYDVIGSSRVDGDESMNDGTMSVGSSGKYIKADSENQFEEIQQVAKDFEDFMSHLGEL
jgi:hypothetical protein